MAKVKEYQVMIVDYCKERKELYITAKNKDDAISEAYRQGAWKVLGATVYKMGFITEEGEQNG